jgi:hypothetical protein
MVGNGGADVFRGGEGNDRIEIGDAGFLDVDGGTGLDTLAVMGDFELDLTAIGEGKVTGIEIIDLNGGAVDLILEKSDVLALLEGGHELRIDGGGDDTVAIEFGNLGEDGTEGDYTVYTDGVFRILIHEDIPPPDLVA